VEEGGGGGGGEALFASRGALLAIGDTQREETGQTQRCVSICQFLFSGTLLQEEEELYLRLEARKEKGTTRGVRVCLQRWSQGLLERQTISLDLARHKGVVLALGLLDHLRYQTSKEYLTSQEHLTSKEYLTQSCVASVTFLV